MQLALCVCHIAAVLHALAGNIIRVASVLKNLVLQGMAGNIIHAIATTNAIIAGFVVIEAIKVLAGAQDQCKVRSKLKCAPYTAAVSANFCHWYLNIMQPHA